ncbi:MAG TPA: NUDIX domain-containing protein [Steroidobacteraceae bacterium]|nr:NUDIX domain-containing protein [Steroidobacteraceae bacterium]
MPEHTRPIVTVDIVILTLRDAALHVALARREQAPHAGDWTLPGGWVHADEDEDALAAAVRILKAKAGLDSPYLEQLKTFASRHRDARGWSVSIAHYALVPFDRVGEEHVKWRAVDTITSLPFDHLEILRTAVERVRSKTAYSSLPVHLMPATFTLSELQRVYEQVLGTALDKRTFRRRVEDLNLVEPAPGARAEGAAHRPAQRFRVKRRFGRELALSEKNLA